MKNIIAFILVALLISSCGAGVVELENKRYQPKISIDGFLQPGKKVDRIHVFRNFKLGVDIAQLVLVLDPAKTIVKIIDESNGNEYDPCQWDK